VFRSLELRLFEQNTERIDSRLAAPASHKPLKSVLCGTHLEVEREDIRLLGSRDLGIRRLQ
jgi:hypothetical protein